MDNYVRHSKHYNVLVKVEDKEKPIINGTSLIFPVVDMFCPVCSMRLGRPIPLQIHQSNKKVFVDCCNSGDTGQRCYFYEDLINEQETTF